MHQLMEGLILLDTDRTVRLCWRREISCVQGWQSAVLCASPGFGDAGFRGLGAGHGHLRPHGSIQTGTPTPAAPSGDALGLEMSLGPISTHPAPHCPAVCTGGASSCSWHIQAPFLCVLQATLPWLLTPALSFPFHATEHQNGEEILGAAPSGPHPPLPESGLCCGTKPSQLLWNSRAARHAGLARQGRPGWAEGSQRGTR